MNYTGPKVKISRKLNILLSPKAKKVTQKKPYPPGQHGNIRRKVRLSDFGRQLLEKQRLRLQYNISERQMINYYKKASKYVGNTADLLVQLLETRLDAIVYKAGFAPTIWAARQYISHGHILVNGKKVDIPSYQLKVNDVVTVKEKSRRLEAIQNAIRSSAPPAYLDVSKAEFSAKLLYIPSREEIITQCEIPLIVEYYSR